MKKILSIVLVAVTLLGVIGCKKDKKDQIDTNSIYLLGYTSSDVADDYLGNTRPSATFEVAMKLSASTVADKGNKKVIGVRFCLGNGAEGGKAFMAYELGNNVAEKEYTCTADGWQYVIFDTPVDITEGSDIYVGYKVTGSGYFLGVEDGNNRLTNNSYIFYKGQWDLIGYGLCIQAICVGGDYSSEKQHDVAAENLKVKANARAGEVVNFSVDVRNAGIKTTGNVKVTCKYGSETVDETVATLRNGESKRFNFTINGIGLDMTKISAEVSEDGVTDENTKNDKTTADINVYAADAPERVCILIEQFTGQECGYCPDGIKNMREAIAGMDHPEKAAWIAHHSGYKDDDFTVTGDNKIARALGVNGAPSCSYNRMPVVEAGSSKAVLVYDPRSATSELLNSLAEIPANATIEMDVAFNSNDSTLTVTVNGMSYIHDNSYITIVICQDSLVGRQSSGGANFVHNETVRHFMTADLGDKLTVDDATGNYTATYTYKIPTAITGVMGKAIATDIPNMFVVAFVHGNTSSKGAVYNAIKANIIKK